jgi:succinate dehydrogenase / fumarate reductase cytochrome b subunit
VSAPAALDHVPATSTGFFSSSIGKKMVMAVTGLALVGFVVVHMVGNLQAYQGAEAFNGYAAALRRYPPLLWGMRSGLLAAAILHVGAAWSLTRANRAARPVGYRRQESRASTYASRTMRWSGVILLLFVVYHLLHLTFGVRAVHPEFAHGDAYHNFVTGFQNPLVSAFYIAAMLALGLHMWHGTWSFLQSLGLSRPGHHRWRQVLATLVTAVVVLGNVSFPIAVLAGVIREEPAAQARPSAPPPVPAR